MLKGIAIGVAVSSICHLIHRIKRLEGSQDGEEEVQSGPRQTESKPEHRPSRSTTRLFETRRAAPSHPLVSLAKILRENHIKDRSDALRLMATLRPEDRPPAGCGLAIYPGSFNPPHNLHVRMSKAVCDVEGVDALWLDMTMHQSKKHYVGSVENERVRMADVAVEEIERAGVTTVQGVMGANGWEREYFDALRVFVDGGEVGGGRKGKLYWVMGSDVVEAMQYYKEKATGLLNAVDRLIVFERQAHLPATPPYSYPES